MKSNKVDEKINIEVNFGRNKIIIPEYYATKLKRIIDKKFGKNKYFFSYRKENLHHTDGFNRYYEVTFILLEKPDISTRIKKYVVPNICEIEKLVSFIIIHHDHHLLLNCYCDDLFDNIRHLVESEYNDIYEKLLSLEYKSYEPNQKEFERKFYSRETILEISQFLWEKGFHRNFLSKRKGDINMSEENEEEWEEEEWEEEEE